ncbi:MAG TPA: hypothetical protein VF553_01840 [Pyrinomonadaceae bacterium]|jgi:hypothetical protein
MNLETIKLVAGRYMELVTHEEYVEWAVSCLESGIDSKNIRILASLQKPLYSSEVEDYFKRSLRDLGWELPDRKECIIEYARSFAKEILSGQVSPLEGCRKIYRIVVDLQYPRELMSWLYLDEGLEPGTYRDLEGKELDEAIIKEARRFIGESDRFNQEGFAL